ncbi:MAG: hypothetical protein HQK66_08905, partial [Desulfamplus sp.]|nr:hypothetical protein [Desulfamplus sp.]
MKKKDKKREGKKTDPGARDDVDGRGTSEKKSFLKLFFPKKLFNLKFILIFTILILVMLGGALGAWFFLFKDKSAGEDELNPGTVSSSNIEASSQKDIPGQVRPEPDFPDIVDIEPFKNVKIMESGDLTYINFSISVELADPDLRTAFESRTDKVREIVESEIKTMTWMSLRAPE